MTENRKELTWIDHQGGKLGYYLDKADNAVLCDYIGDTAILYLPHYLEYDGGEYEVCENIPDESFQSCKCVKLIVADCRDEDWNIGCFVFTNCSDLKGIVGLQAYYWDYDGRLIDRKYHSFPRIDEFSFTDKRYVPLEKIINDEISFESDDYYNGNVNRFFNEIIKNDLTDDLILLLFNKRLGRYSGWDLDDYSITHVNKPFCPSVNEIFIDENVENAVARIARCWLNAKQT